MNESRLIKPQPVSSERLSRKGRWAKRLALLYLVLFSFPSTLIDMIFIIRQLVAVSIEWGEKQCKMCAQRVCLVNVSINGERKAHDDKKKILCVMEIN